MINPSHHEGFSRVLLEGAYVGLYCIANDIPGTRNIIKNFDDEEFIVINSDIWTDYNLKVLRDLSLEDNLAHIVLTNTPDYLDGDFSCDGKNLLVGNSYVFSGIGKYHRELFIKHSEVELGDILRSEKKITFSIYDGKWIMVEIINLLMCKD